MDRASNIQTMKETNNCRFGVTVYKDLRYEGWLTSVKIQGRTFEINSDKENLIPISAIDADRLAVYLNTVSRSKGWSLFFAVEQMQ